MAWDPSYTIARRWSTRLPSWTKSGFWPEVSIWFAVWTRQRFIISSTVGWTTAPQLQTNAGFGNDVYGQQDIDVKARLINLISAVRTLLRSAYILGPPSVFATFLTMNTSTSHRYQHCHYLIWASIRWMNTLDTWGMLEWRPACSATFELQRGTFARPRTFTPICYCGWSYFSSCTCVWDVYNLLYWCSNTPSCLPRFFVLIISTGIWSVTPILHRSISHLKSW